MAVLLGRPNKTTVATDVFYYCVKHPALHAVLLCNPS